jgi:hypothetical protein
MSEKLLAKIPNTGMWLSLTYLLDDNSYEKSEIDIKQQQHRIPCLTKSEYIVASDQYTRVHLRDDIRSWLRDNCIGQWKVMVSEWKIEFDRKEDYVNFCLNWYNVR